MEHVEMFPYKIKYSSFKPFKPIEIKPPKMIAALYIEPAVNHKNNQEIHKFGKAYFIDKNGKYFFTNLFSLWNFILNYDSLHIYTINNRYILPLLNMKEILPKLGIEFDIYKISNTYFARIYGKKGTIVIRDLLALVEKSEDEFLEYGFFSKNRYAALAEVIYYLLDETLSIFNELGFPYFYGAISTNAFALLHKQGISYSPNRENSIGIEVMAHRGGLIGIKQVGQLDGVYYKLDINSAYPYAMIHKLPRFYKKTLYDISLSEFDILKEKYAGIYDVEFSLNKPALAIRYCSSTILSAGNIRAALTDLEVDIIRRYGSVHKIHKAVLYEKEDFLKDFVLKLYSYRLKYDGFKKEIVKRILNSIYGKFIQSARSDGIMYLKEFTFPAISAYITSIIRARMIELIEKAGWDNVYYFDTDGLIVNEKGFDKLKELIGKNIGALKIEEVSNDIEIIGPKFYRIGDTYKFAGIPKDALIEENLIKYERLKTFSLNKRIIFKKYKYIKTYLEESRYIFKNFPKFNRYSYEEPTML